MFLKDICLFFLEDLCVNEKVVINVGGICYEIYIGIFKNIFDIRLYWIIENKIQLLEYDFNMNEYFFDCYLIVFV